MTEASPIAIVVRWLSLAASVGAVGAFSTLLLAGRPPGPTAAAWERRIVRASGVLVAAALVSSVAVLAQELAVLVGRPTAVLDRAALARFTLDTHAGHVWLARAAVLVLLAAFLVVRGDLRRRVDWLASRGQGVLLSGLALALVAASSHAAAVSPGSARAVAIDVLHLLATGVWLGGLVPLALLLSMTSREAGEDSRAYAVIVTRRFSTAALVAMAALVASGVGNTIAQVASIPALVGTTHGRLLLAKLGGLAIILGVASVNRRRLVPALSGDAELCGRPAMRRLARLVTFEAALGTVILLLVAAMTVLPPGRHQQPTWPFSFRMSFEALEASAGVRMRALIGSQIGVLGFVALVVALASARLRRHLAAAAAVLLAVATGIVGPTLAVDAYPTTYRRPAQPWDAASIAAGLSLFEDRCARCHGPSGKGDGPDGRALPERPADLTSAHVAHHTAGDLFWWITNGIGPAGMPPFGARLTETDRWDVINAVRALSLAPVVRALGPKVAPEGPRLVAPDFTFSEGPARPRSLRGERGRVVVLVLYTLPGSHDRLALLARSAKVLRALGAEVIAVPENASPDAIRELGTDPPMLFSVVTDGASDIVDTYGLFARTPHAEFLVDRWGYLRAMPEPRTDDVNALLAEIQQLNEETGEPPPPEEHAH